MAQRMVGIVHEESGRRSTVTQTAFDKVWSYRGYVLASDFDNRDQPEAESEAVAGGGGAGGGVTAVAAGAGGGGGAASPKVGETGTGDSKQ